MFNWFRAAEPGDLEAFNELKRSSVFWRVFLWFLEWAARFVVCLWLGVILIFIGVIPSRKPTRWLFGLLHGAVSLWDKKF